MLYGRVCCMEGCAVWKGVLRYCMEGCAEVLYGRVC